jgi:hypothetical protein
MSGIEKDVEESVYLNEACKAHNSGRHMKFKVQSLKGERKTDDIDRQTDRQIARDRVDCLDLTDCADCIRSESQ